MIRKALFRLFSVIFPEVLEQLLLQEQLIENQREMINNLNRLSEIRSELTCLSARRISAN